MSFPQVQKRGKSTRELRRLAEQQERKSAVQIPDYKKAQFAAQQAVIDRIQRNGITMKDLEANYNIGFEEGYKVAAEPVIKTCYAAICLALKEMYGFGKKRCCSVLNAVDKNIMYSLTSDEAILEVWNKIGLQIDFNEVLDERITETEETKA